MMKCRECNSEMYLDDVGRTNSKHKDEYWNCPNCQTSCIVEIRCGITMGESWHTENNGEAKDTYVDKFGK